MPLPGNLRAVLLAAILAGAGCDRALQGPESNLPPETDVLAGNPTISDSEIQVDLRLSGTDPDGSVNHYEISWEDAESWSGPIYNPESTFTAPASSDDHGRSRNDLRTVFVRSVDDQGRPDETPAYRSFSAGSIAPRSQITFGPRNAGYWWPDVEFEWIGQDDDGFVVGYRRALTTIQEWRDDQGIADSTVLPPQGALTLIAWLDTLTCRPLPGGGHDCTDSAWKYTELDSVLFEEMPETPSRSDWYLFAVKAIDDLGLEEELLISGVNTRLFNVRSTFDGPRIHLASNIFGTWVSANPTQSRDVFAAGARFWWTATPGETQTPVTGFSYALDDSSNWSPFSLSDSEWPAQTGGGKSLWFPEPGSHTFFLRAIDQVGFTRTLVAPLRVLGGPRTCDPSERTILVVLDTDSNNSLIIDSVLPPSFPEIEDELMEYCFGGYRYRIFKTRATTTPRSELLSCASSTFWFHTAAAEVDDSVLLQHHADPPSILPSYVAAGGNLFLCGVQPGNALRFFDNNEFTFPQIQNHPVLFVNTLLDNEFVPHWAASHLGIARIEESVGNTQGAVQTKNRLRTATAQIAGFPDLLFDPLTWPQGPLVRGFGYYDRGVIPLTGDIRFPDAEVLYTFNDESIPIAVRRLSPEGPGINGNTVVLGFHPYFLDRPASRELIRAVLADFGEAKRVRRTAVFDN